MTDVDTLIAGFAAQNPLEFVVEVQVAPSVSWKGAYTGLTVRVFCVQVVAANENNKSDTCNVLLCDLHGAVRRRMMHSLIQVEVEDAGGEEAVAGEVEARLAKEQKDSAQLRVVTGRCV